MSTDTPTPEDGRFVETNWRAVAFWLALSVVYVLALGTALWIAGEAPGG